MFILPHERALFRQTWNAGSFSHVDRAVAPHSWRICFRWSGNVQSAMALLQAHGITIIEGPTPRQGADGRPSQSIFFRGLDKNLLELMAANIA
ncbi:VOC family protein [Geminicoccus flavidas]|uniref:hypothetical protein n=1 Tax=Geminicoccus flavidas TaxID=2506407 RepID=UPI00135C81F0|nr:hypothetical protein [Geminicoccus flavidas]